jgi:hypothetical protein
MTPPPTSIDGTDITGATIDGQDVQEITIDGQTVFTSVQDAIFVDDWADGNLFSNRTSYDNLAYTGPSPDGRFNPVGRFPWETPSGGNPMSVSGGKLLVQSDELTQNDATIDMTTGKTVWEAEFDFTNGGTGGGRETFWNFAYGTESFDGANRANKNSYVLSLVTGNNITLDHFDANGSDTELGRKNGFTRTVHDIRIERASNGDFSVFEDGVEIINTNDTSTTSTSFTGFSSFTGDVGNVTVDYEEVYQPA